MADPESPTPTAVSLARSGCEEYPLFYLVFGSVAAGIALALALALALAKRGFSRSNLSLAHLPWRPLLLLPPLLLLRWLGTVGLVGFLLLMMPSLSSLFLSHHHQLVELLEVRDRFRLPRLVTSVVPYSRGGLWALAWYPPQRCWRRKQQPSRRHSL